MLVISVRRREAGNVRAVRGGTDKVGHTVALITLGQVKRELVGPRGGDQSPLEIYVERLSAYTVLAVALCWCLE